MQPLITKFDSLEKLYRKELSIIKEVKFTFREVDILACILHNRGEKKIASLCSISPKTVSTHVYNIMGKLGCNSKDQIIDFIEGSGKLKFLREYYLQLLTKNTFEKALTKIANQANKNKLHCYCNRDEAMLANSSLYQSLQKHLSLAGIILSELTKKDQNIDNTLIIDLKAITEENYYQDISELVVKIISSSKADEILEEFKNSYKTIKDNYEGKNISQEMQSKSLHNKKSIIIMGIFFMTLAITSFIYNFIYQDHLNIALENKNTPEIIQDLEAFLKALSDGEFTANNLDQKQQEHNQSLVKKVEQIVEYGTSKKVQDYLQKAEMSSDILISYLYNLQSLASYYMYNAHNGLKAKEILLHAKQVAENYVSSRSEVVIDFSKSEPQEIYAELQVIKHLPEIYTRLIYSLGRTYLYMEDYEGGKEFFVLSKNLGLKLNLFEGYLSDVSGLLAIAKRDIEKDIKEGRTILAQESLRKLITDYDVSANDSNSYIIDYNPRVLEQKTIVPSQQSHNIISCRTNIISIYNMLMQISDNKQDLEAYAIAINNHLKKVIGLIDQPRKAANLYNNLGNSLLILWNRGLKTNVINKTITKQIFATDPTNYNSLELSEKLFEQSKSISRNVDFTKADAYDGLIRLYQAKLVQKTPSKEEEARLLQAIKDFTEKRDHINQSLNRKT